MEMVFLEEEPESSVKYEKISDASAKDAASQSRSGADSKVPAAVPDTVTTNKSEREKATALLQTSYNNLTEEKNQLQTSYKNLTEEKNQLQTSYKNLTEEKKQLQTSYKNLTEEKKQLQTSYKNLTEEKNQLQTSYNNLTEEKNQLQTSYNNLTEEKKQLQTSYKNLTEEKNQLQTSYNNLTEEKNQLQTSYNNLVYERHQLGNNLTEEKNQLQTSYNQENAPLQERYEALTDDRNNLHRKLQGWMYFRGSFYYISSVEKTWQNSREDCHQKGADLIIINSKEEQVFIYSPISQFTLYLCVCRFFLFSNKIFTNQFKKLVWIGLTDSQTDGRWKWVDGTPMTKSYWGSGEPNGGKSENCVEAKHFNNENSWNDVGCSASRTWICEKKVSL
ncbi:C-type lectin domain family 4 member M-like [Pempheris klunzingeri]|uniref:C-type lectin domain family 4 member M-like n=1 Tax=Pempheris klunzingeri TaxID=3127111 RepID=UPI00397FA825